MSKETRDEVERILKRLYTVILRDGEQFVAGAIRQIANECGVDFSGGIKHEN